MNDYSYETYVHITVTEKNYSVNSIMALNNWLTDWVWFQLCMISVTSAFWLTHFKELVQKNHSFVNLKSDSVGSVRESIVNSPTAPNDSLTVWVWFSWAISMVLHKSFWLIKEPDCKSHPFANRTAELVVYLMMLAENTSIHCCNLIRSYLTYPYMNILKDFLMV